MGGMMGGGKGGGSQVMPQGGGMGQNPGLASLFAGNQAANPAGAMRQLAPITAPVRPQFAPPPRLAPPMAQQVKQHPLSNEQMQAMAREKMQIGPGRPGTSQYRNWIVNRR